MSYRPTTTPTVIDKIGMPEITLKKDSLNPIVSPNGFRLAQNHKHEEHSKKFSLLNPSSQQSRYASNIRSMPQSRQGKPKPNPQPRRLKLDVAVPMSHITSAIKNFNA